MRRVGPSTITGLNILEALLFETESPAARFLTEQGITRQGILNLIVHGKGWYHVQEHVQQWLKFRPVLTRRLKEKRKRLGMKARPDDRT